MLFAPISTYLPLVTLAIGVSRQRYLLGVFRAAYSPNYSSSFRFREVLGIPRLF